MYSTLSLQAYRREAAASAGTNSALFPPPGGPHTGWLLLQNDEEEEEEAVSGGGCCWGFCVDTRVRELPFPQDRSCVVHTSTTSSTGTGTSTTTHHYDRVYFIPVLGEPISSNKYYVVHAEGRHKAGLVATCSREEDMSTCCCCRCIQDVPPRPLDLYNPYQQMQIQGGGRSGRFEAHCVAADGFPPLFLRRRKWDVSTKKLAGEQGRLQHLRGGNARSRSELQPPLSFPGFEKWSPAVVACEWYCPFIFVKESGQLGAAKKQLVESPFYRLTLEKVWEQIHYRFNEAGGGDEGCKVSVEETVGTEEAVLFGSEIAEKKEEGDGSIGFRLLRRVREGEMHSVTLSQPMVRGIWEGRSRKGVGDVRVHRIYELKEWPREFAVYVGCERFVLRRSDGTLVLSLTFRNVDEVYAKCDLQMFGETLFK